MTKQQVIISVLLLSFWSCRKEQMDDCFISTGSEITEERALASFSKVELNDRIHFNYYYSPNYYVKIKAGENLMEGIKTKVEGDLLFIENTNRCNWVRSFKKEISVDVYAPEFSEMVYRGSGKVLFVDTLKASYFRLNLWDASGNMHLLLKCNYIELKTHTGPGAIYASGECRELVAYLGGIGKIEAPALVSQKSLVINKNTGNIFINCQSKMQAEISGQGNIEYIGNPVIEYTNSGSGELIKR